MIYLQNYNFCVIVSSIKFKFATRNPEIFCIYYHTHPYIIECWITLVKHEVGSDFSVDQGLPTNARFAQFAVRPVKIFRVEDSFCCQYQVYPVRYVNPTDLPYVEI